MPDPTRVYVNLQSHIDNGLPVRVQTTKSASTAGTRQAQWTLAGKSANLGDNQGMAGCSLLDGAKRVEELPVQAGVRVFKNRVKLGRIGGNIYTVTASKIQSRPGPFSRAQRGLAPIELQSFRKLFFTLNYMTGLDASAEAVATDLPTLLALGFIELSRKTPVPATNAAVAARSWILDDSVEALLAAAPDAPFARQRCPAGDEAFGLWMRLVLVESVAGFSESMSREFARGDARQDAQNHWILEKTAPASFVYVAPDAVKSLTLQTTGSVEVASKQAAIVTTKKTSSGSTDDTYVVELTQQTAGDLVRTVRDNGAGIKAVRLRCTFTDGTTDTVCLEDFHDDRNTLSFRWSPAGKTGPYKKNWTTAAKIASQLLEGPTATHEMHFDASGNEPHGWATAVLSADASKVTLTITDAAWNGWITTHFNTPAPEGATRVLKMADRPSKRLSGSSSGANIVIAVRELADRCGGDTAKTHALTLRAIVHEIIHSIGGVAKDLDGVAHPSFYPPSNGGSATDDTAHCSSGCGRPEAADAIRRDPDARRAMAYEPGKTEIYIPPTSTSAICVMYHRALLPNFLTATLCEHCIRQLRLLDLSPRALEPNFQRHSVY